VQWGWARSRRSGLAEARRKRQAVSDRLRAGEDPIAERVRERVVRRVEEAKAVTFEAAAVRHIEANRAGWSNAKHGTQWLNTLRDYAFPVFGNVPVQDIDTTLVLKAIEPIWTTKTETASRVRMRIENVIDSATARGERTGDNPARWKGHLDKLLPSRSKVKKVKHFGAMPYVEVPAFFKELMTRESVSARALAFVMLTVPRSTELRLATWREIDLAEATWNVPPERMKKRRPHRVPLTPAAIALLGKPGEPDAPLFASYDGELSDGAMRMFLQRDMGRPDCTPHGMRSSFRDWVEEQTNFAFNLAEASLAHAVKDKTVAAYQRGDLFDKRRRLMEAWAHYCTS
jgi:integrase